MAKDQEPTYLIELYEPSGGPGDTWQGVLRYYAGKRDFAIVYAKSVSLVLDMLYVALEHEGVDAPGLGD